MTEPTEKGIRSGTQWPSPPCYDQHKPAIQLKHRPLFVLRYKTHRVFFRALIFSFMGLILGFMAIALLLNPDSGFIELIGVLIFGFCSFAAIVMVCDLLLFKEIRLYSDRIVKVWKGYDILEIQLRDAKYRVGVTSIGTIVQIYDPAEKWLSLTNRLFMYSDFGADPSDMRKLHGVMSELSGRDIEEFERYTAGKKKWLMKNRNT